MTRALLLAAAITAACAAEPDTAPVEQHSEVYCNLPFKVACYPWTPGGDNAYCNSTCQAFNGVPGFCPEESQSEWDWCAFHPDQGSCVGTVPHFVHYCRTGLTSLTGDPTE